MNSRGWLDEKTHQVSSLLSKELDFRVTESMSRLIDQGNQEIAGQFVPSAQELEVKPNETSDPIGDDIHNPVPGITHRYSDRVLLNISHACAVYCRFCLRKEKVSKPGHSLNTSETDKALDYIASHTSIKEVIFSGGDPFILSPRLIRSILARLDCIEHVKLVRFHTRVPTVDPGRVTPQLIDVLTSTTKAVRVVTHINTVKEISESSEEVLKKFINSGVPVLSQSVILKGINNSLDALLNLFWKLIEMRVTPYYLHYLDLARGTSHFRVPLEQVIEWHHQLRGKIPGYGIPELMVDIPGGLGKIAINSENAKQTGGKWHFRSPIHPDKWITIDYQCK